MAFALLGVLWLRRSTHAATPALEPVYGVALVSLLVFAGLMAATFALAMRYVIEQPLQRLAAGLRRARDGDFLHRLPVESEDELGAVAETFNAALAAITDLNARHIDDARELELKAQLEARVKELTLLFDLARRLGGTLELDRVLSVLTELAGRGLGDHAFAVLLVEEATGDLVVRGVSGLPDEVSGTRIRAGDGPAGWAARERRTVLIPDTREDPRRPLLPWQGGAAGSILAVPMLHQDECAGVLVFFRPAAEAFSAAEVRLLESVAGQATLSIENAQLHQKMVRLSQTDALTGAHNRRSLFARLAAERERCARFDHRMAVALVDVDHFKRLQRGARARRGRRRPPAGGAPPRGRGPPRWTSSPATAARSSRWCSRGRPRRRARGGREAARRRWRRRPSRTPRAGRRARDDLGRRRGLPGRRAGPGRARRLRRRRALRREARRADAVRAHEAGMRATPAASATRGPRGRRRGAA